MKPSFEQTLVDVWRQVLVENASVIELGGKRSSSHHSTEGLRQVDFVLTATKFAVWSRTADTKSRWAQLARTGEKVMQFLERGSLCGGRGGWKATLYGR